MWVKKAHSRIYESCGIVNIFICTILPSSKTRIYVCTISTYAPNWHTVGWKCQKSANK